MIDLLLSFAAGLLAGYVLWNLTAVVWHHLHTHRGHR
jgi:hypothetical protein